MRITSSAFDNEAHIPKKYTCDGDDTRPPLAFDDVPDEARSLALIVDDPDAPSRVWVHWLVWGLPADLRALPAGMKRQAPSEELAGMREGTNDFGGVGYGGPCPPPGHGTHHYRFTVYALDRDIPLEPGATRDALEAQLEGHVLEQARLVGTYER